MNQPASVQSERIVRVSPKEVFRAFTNSTALREWLCDVATTDPHPGGRIYLWWSSGYYAAGEYIQVEPEKRVEFSYHGQGEPGTTRVEVSFEGQDRETRLRLVHAGIGEGEEWAKHAAEIREGWEIGLDNLVSVLEAGPDLRIVNRPMLGITIDPFDQEIAAKLSVPVNEGVRLGSVIEGMGAAAAGLEPNDVVVGVDGKPTANFPDLRNVLQKRKGGDRVKVEFYRGKQKLTTDMELSRRPVPEIPAQPGELARRVEDLYRQVLEELTACLEGVTEAEAAHRPRPDEWNAKEILAHLIHNERAALEFIEDLVAGQERVSDGFGDNVTSKVEATALAYPTVRDLLDEFRRNQQETIGMLEKLPADFLAHKGTYWRLVFNFLSTPDVHARGHFDQIQAAIESAKG